MPGEYSLNVVISVGTDNIHLLQCEVERRVGQDTGSESGYPPPQLLILQSLNSIELNSVLATSSNSQVVKTLGER